MAPEPDESPLPEDFLRDLRSSARAAPDEASRTRIERKVRARTGGGVGGGAGTSWVMAAIALGLVAALFYVAWPRDTVPAAPHTEIDRAPASRAPTPAAPRLLPSVPPTPPATPPAPAEPERARDLAPAPASSARAGDLPTEIELLDAAHGTLSGSPARALGYLDRHAALYRDGLFEEEREALAIEALVRLDRVPQANLRAARFFARHPSTPHRPRLREILRAAGSTEAW